ncbi:sugar/nucleoside kinase (ribokinase family) [Kribbella voronezhensis]|uniref:Sugar/nucleoside kinase (Ribokinase family) n=1 Tax=Kribbella voronezhensis TaxID=2512212 RepID=A0A4V3FKM2_9ACTN|nr:PfkB family carbohydrate kinase [Kribbella voronezhensis]TDU90753.1 sugar/nucleoside kinase (ribokinase family) [Kribbella voronezhensis]
MRLVHLGNVVVDLVLTVGDLPARGGDVIASSTTTSPGGGFNVMAAAARLGLTTLYAGALGTGPFGDRARAALLAEGIDWLLPARTGLDTGFVVTLVDSSGERTFVTSPGAEATLRSTDLFQPGLDDLVYLSGYSLLHDANRDALIRWLPTIPAGVQVFFDPGPLVADIPSTTLEPVLARADWLSCNSTEAQAMTGSNDPTEAARALMARAGRSSELGAGRVLVRVGRAGCLLGVQGEVVSVAGFAVEAVDLNGAGDAHSGAFLAGIAEGKEPAEAARWANAAAALAVTRRGPATGPSRAGLEGFLRAH